MLVPGLAATIALAGASRGALLDHASRSHDGRRCSLSIIPEAEDRTGGYIRRRNSAFFDSNSACVINP